MFLSNRSYAVPGAHVPAPVRLRAESLWATFADKVHSTGHQRL